MWSLKLILLLVTLLVQGQPQGYTNTYVAVPGGTKNLGEVDPGRPWDYVHSVTISNFQVMQTEVTNAQFYSFLQAQIANLEIKNGWVTYTGAPTPLKIFKLNDAIKCQNSATSCTTLIKDVNAENRPVTHVTYHGAALFAEAETKAQNLPNIVFELPTAAEWEYMAKLSDNLYATTDGQERACATTPNMSCANTLLATDSLNGVSSRDFSGNKVYFLAENVAEWTQDNQANGSFNFLLDSTTNPVNNIFDQDNDFPASFFNNKIVKGGSYKDTVAQKVSSFRAVRPDQALEDVGFRLVKRPTTTLIQEITLAGILKYCNFWEATVYSKDGTGNISIDCATCPNSCETCFATYDQADNEVLKCATCHLNAELDTANPGTCKCKQGFEPNQLTGECQPSNAKCSNNEFFDTVYQICRRCDTPCKGCTNNSISCTECMPNAVKTAAGVCICQEGYIDFLGLGCLPVAPKGRCPRGTEANREEKCMACPPTCSACGQGWCSLEDCIPGSIYDGSGACECPEGTHLVGHSCVCSKGFFKTDSGCEPCTPGCAQCKDADTCDVCVDNKAKFDPSSGVCECQDGLEWNSDHNECVIPSVMKCHPSCAIDACHDEDRNHCTICRNNKFLYDEEAHRCDCPSGSVWNENKSVCVPCANPSCKRCSLQDLNQCTVCDGISILDNTKNCVCPKHYSMSAAQRCEPKLYFPSCGLDSFISKSGACEKCHPSCKTCMGPNPDQCVTCSQGAVFDSPWNNLGKFSFGTCGCEPGFFMEGNICKPCDQTCHLCSGPGPKSCITCKPGLIEVRKPNGVFECGCGLGSMLVEGGCVPIEATKCGNTFKEYMDSNNVCQPCPDKCSSCDDAGVCTGCQLPYIFDMTTDPPSCILPSGFFHDQNGSMAKCHPTCKSCVGPSPKDCHECKKLRVEVFDSNNHMTCACAKHTLIAEDGSCMLRENPAGYYTTEEGLLNKCHSSCKTCVGPKENQCASCADKAMLVNKSSPFYGRCVCPPKMYADPTGVCKPCAASCAECVGPDFEQCTSCDKFSQLAESLFGQVCNCKTGFNRDIQGACSVKNNSNCGYHEIFSDVDKKCVPCDAKCDTCSGSPTSCVECKYPLSKDAAGVCQCPESQRWDDTAKSCISCPGNCKKCDRSGCLECVNGKTASGACVCDNNQQATRSGACWPRWQSDSCPFNTYFDEEHMKCAPCHVSCTSCSGPSKNECLACPNGRQIMKGACSCPPGTYLDQLGDCKPCTDGCGKCNDTTACLECVPNASKPLTANTNTCVCATNFSWNPTTRSCEPLKHNSKCQVREYLDTADNKCKPCGFECWSCIGPNSNQCIICPNGATKTNASPAQTFSNVSIGTCSCPKGTFYDIKANKCSSCDFHCDNCFGPFPDQCRSCSIGSILDKTGKCVCNPADFEEGPGVCLIKLRNESCLGPVDHYIGKVINDQECKAKCVDAGCAVCNSQTAGSCSACNVFANFEIAPVSNACVCRDGFYLSSGKCMPCVNSRCATCNDGTSCASCLNGYTLNNPTTKANDCSHCTTKVDAGICLEPNVNCAPGRFSASASCQDCSPKCATCYGASEWACLSCKPGMVPFGNTCVCEKGLFWDSTRNACTPCSSACDTCENGANNCLVCALGFVEQKPSSNTQTQSQPQYKQCVCPPNTNLVDGKCTPNLNLGCDDVISNYISPSGECVPCDSKCKACAGEDTQCLICPDDKDVRINEDGSINCVCPRGTFLGLNSDNQLDCMSCDPSCADCNDEGNEYCTVCAPDYLWDPFVSACKPTEGWTQVDGEWSYEAIPGPCGSNKFGTVGSCQNCAPGCKICTDANSCTVCDWGKLWDNSAKKCYIPGSFETTTTTSGVTVISLSKCNSKCATCSDATTCLTCILGRKNEPACDKCADGWYMAGDGKCYKLSSDVKCPGGYIDEQGICGLCHPSCSSCIGPASDQCTECSYESLPTKYPGLFKCGCQEGYFYDFRSFEPTCTPCPDTECKSCFLDKNGVQCKTCSPTTTLIQNGDNSKCECLQGFSRTDNTDICTPDNSCEFGSYMNKATGDCDLCKPSCNICLGEAETDCIACSEPYVLYPIDNPDLNSNTGAPKQPVKGYCGCPLGTYATIDEDGFEICAECISGCKKCNNDQSCLECDDDHILKNDLCECRPGFVFNDVSKSCVIDLSQQCLPGNYFDLTESRCKACANSCATCTAASSCTSCMKGLSFNAANGSCTCSLGFYNAAPAGSKPDCKPCGSGCGVCTGAEPNKCITCIQNADLASSICRCKQGFAFSIERNECYPISADKPHKFLNKSGAYLECDPSCKECAGLGKDQCTICNKGATLSYTDPNKVLYGICKCPDNQFFSPEGFCIPCNPLCASCTGPSEFECRQCAAYASKVENGSCQCINSYKLNYSTRKCEAVVLFPECGLRKYKSISGTCEPCHKSCLTCDGASEKQCVSCEGGSALQVLSKSLNGLELGRCDCDGKYFYNTNLTPSKCDSCDPTCMDCFGALPQQCTICAFDRNLTPATYTDSTGATKQGNKCVCKDGYQESNPAGQCNPIVASTVCSKDQYQSGTSCFKCDESCNTCSAAGVSACLSCNVAAGLVLVKSSITATSGTCSCPEGSYFDQVNRACRRCHSSCRTCNSFDDKSCLTCAPYSKLDSGKCVCTVPTNYDAIKNVCIGNDTCSDGSYNGKTGNCAAKCPALCGKCTGPEPGYCTTCKAGTVTVNYSVPGFVTCICPDGKYFDGISCVNCHYSCGKCTGPNKWECTDCTHTRDFHLVDSVQTQPSEAPIKIGTCDCKVGYADRNSNQCVLVPLFDGCELSQYIDLKDGTCNLCHPSCSNCIGPDQRDCVTCPPNSFIPFPQEKLDSKGKITTFGACLCQNGFYWNQDEEVCTRCLPNCQRCKNGETCEECNVDRIWDDINEVCTCKSGTQERNGKCEYITQGTCPVKTYLKDAKCLNCDSNCMLCKGPSRVECTACDYMRNYNLLEVYDDQDVLLYATCECKKGFFKNANGACEPCHNTCKSCTGKNPDQCLTCDIETMIAVKETATTVRCECKKGSLWDELSASCIDPKSECDEGFFLSAGRVCSRCAPECGICAGPTANDCIDCAVGLELDVETQQCVCSNPNQFIDTSSGIAECIDCSVMCDPIKGCSGPSPADCKSCARFAIPRSYNVDGKEEIECTCPPNHFFDGNECTPIDCDDPFTMCSVDGCDESCNGCVGPDAHQCALCYTDAVLQVAGIQEDIEYGKCQCKPGFALASDFSCVKCPDGCLECKLNAADQPICSRCQALSVLLYDLSGCECIDGFYFDSISESCMSYEHLECPVGMFLVDKKCQACHSSCHICSGPKPTDCLVCKTELNFEMSKVGTSAACLCAPGTYQEEDRCLPCNPTCSKCVGPAQNDCTECYYGMELKNDAPAACVCPTGEIYDPKIEGCVAIDDQTCDSPCLTCTASGLCIDCQPNFIMIKSDWIGIVECVCPPGKYFNIGDAQCADCDQSCGECFGPHPDQCTSCRAGENLELSYFSSKCLCPMGSSRYGALCLTSPPSNCMLKQFQDASKNCQNCDKTCLTCSGPNNNNCLDCDYSVATKTTDNRCVCKPGFFRDANSECQPCDPRCKECTTSATTCSACFPGSSISGTTCNAQQGWIWDNINRVFKQNNKCDLREYLKGEDCLRCNEACYTCNGPNPDNCTSCDPKSQNVLKGSSCECKDGLFRDKSGECVRCNSRCANCVGDREDQCLTCPVNSSPVMVPGSNLVKCTCNNGYMFNQYTQKCESETACGVGLYKSATGCQECSKSCASCVGPNPDQCLSCPSTRLNSLSKIYEGKQLLKCYCDDSKFESSSGECLACHKTCQTCRGPSEFDCNICKMGSSLVEKSGVSKCECNPYFTKDTTTLVCTPQATSTKCNLSQFYNLFLATPACQECDLSCNTCIGEKFDDCISCPPLAVFMPVSDIGAIRGICQCPAGSYMGKDANGKKACLPCAKGCAKCDANKCLECSGHYRFNESSVCVCPWALTSTGNCQPPTANAACTPGTFWDSVSSSCNKCHSSCLTCYGPSFSDCTSCDTFDHFVWDTQNIEPIVDKVPITVGKCKCAPGFYLTFGHCKLCDSTCQICTGPRYDECLRCKTPDMILDEGTCSCPVGKIFNYDLEICALECAALEYTDFEGNCQDCAPECDGCYGPGNDKCINCASGYVGQWLDSGDFICKCPRGTYLDQGECLDCDAKCDDCLGTADNCIACADPKELKQLGTQGSCVCKFGWEPDVNGVCQISKINDCSYTNQYVNVDGDCIDCDPSCGTCKGSKPYECIICKANAEFYSGMCICNSGYFMNESGDCVPCGEKCHKCDQDHCFDCPPGTFSGDGGNCDKCSDSCLTCFGATNTECSSCEYPKKLSKTANGSECVCPSGWITNGSGICEPPTDGCPIGHFLSSGACLKCSNKCSSCIGPKDSDCTSCFPEQNRSLFSQATVGNCKCDQGFVEVNGECVPCDPKCKLCNGLGPDRCTACKDGMNLLPNAAGSSCFCNEGTFWSKYAASCIQPDHYWANEFGFFKPCDSDCDTCVGPNKDECAACDSLKNLVEDPNRNGAMIGKCVCDKGFFRNSFGECEECDDLCTSCSGPGKCSACTSFATLKTAATGSYCECNPNYKPEQGLCVSALQSGCASGCTCHESCFACSGTEPHECLTCASGMIFSPVSTTSSTAITGFCKCPAGQRLEGTSCQPCGVSCQDCDNTECTTCIPNTKPPVDATFDCECQDNYILDNATGKCAVDSSLLCQGKQGYYPGTSGNCEPCHPSCSSCTGPKETECITCKIDGQILNANNVCVCPVGTVVVNGVCVPCDKNCLTCSGSPTNCSTCRADFQQAPVSGKCVCPTGAILDTKNNACVAPITDNTCHATCKICLAPNAADQCTECKTGLVPLNRASIFPCGCPVGKFLSSGTCVNCDPKCTSCIGSATSCTACAANANLDYTDMACKCGTGYVANVSTGVCEVAKGSVGCPSNQFDADNTDAVSCRNCHASCLSCIGPNDTDCLACPTGTEIVDSDNISTNGVKCQCKPGFFFSSGTCTACPVNCSECSSLTVCTTCKEGSVLSSNRCICDFGFTADSTGKCQPPQGSSSKCSFNQYLSKTGFCLDCHYSCLTCSEGSEFKCLTCAENRVKDINGVCICKNGFYATSSGACMPCNSSCTKCTGPNRDSCQACVSTNSFLVAEQNSCKCFDTAQTDLTLACTPPNTTGCVAGQFRDSDSTCKACNASCATCFGTATSCLKCADKYVLNDTGACVCSGYLNVNVCTICPSLCSECTASGCTTCAVGAVRDDVTGACKCDVGYYLQNNSCMLIPTCNTSEFFSTTLKRCSACHLTCNSCSEATYQDCTSCKTNATLMSVSSSKAECKCNLGYYLDNATGNCLQIPTCSVGQFLSTTYKCVACHPTCNECAGPNEGDCISCKQGISITITNTTNKTGLCRCPAGKFFDSNTKLCVDCNTACATCSGAGSNNCLTCNVGYIKDLETGVCNCNINGGSYLNANRECKICNAGCAACGGPSAQECTKCKDDKVLAIINAGGSSATGSCTCKGGFYYDTATDSCKQLPNCPGENYFVTFDANNRAVCTKCDDSCRTCLGAGADKCTSCPVGVKLLSSNTVVSYTGPISGTCTCSNLSGTQCQDIPCPTSAGFYITTPTNTSSLPFCAQCDKSCKTCSNGTTTGCLTCEFNYILTPNSSADPSGTCKCDPNYQDPKDPTRCNTSLTPQSSGSCPLSKEVCSSAVDCTWSTTGTSTNQLNDKCLKQVYDYCCTYNSSQSGCSSINYQFKDCSLIAVPNIESAKFSDDSTSIRIKFSNGVFLRSKKCVDIFNDSANILGTDAECSQDDLNSPSILNIRLGYKNTVTVGTKIGVKSGAYSSNNKYASRTNNYFLLTIDSPNSVPKPDFDLQVPDTVGTCGNNVAKAIVKGNSGNKDLTYEWKVNGSVVSGATTSSLSFTASGTTMTISCTVRNFLGGEFSGSKTLNVASEAINVAFPYDTLNADSSKEVFIKAKIDRKGCNNSEYSSFSKREWTLVDTDDTSFTQALSQYVVASDPNSIKIPANTLIPGKRYKFQFSVSSTATSGSGSVSGLASITVNTKTSSINVQITGGDLGTSVTNQVYLDGSASTDPNDIKGAFKSSWAYSWTCEDWTSKGLNPLYSRGVTTTNLDQEVIDSYRSYKPTTCLDAGGANLISTIKPNGATLSIPASKMPSGKIFYFILKISYNNGSVTGTGYTWVKTTDASVQIGVQLLNSPQYLSSGDNTLEASVTSPDSNYSIQWSYLQSTTDTTTITWLSGTTRPKVKFSGQGLNIGTIYNFQVSVTRNGQTATATYSGTLNSPPSGGGFTVTKQSDNLYTIDFGTWTDKEGDLPLYYMVKSYPPSTSTETSKLIKWGQTSVFTDVLLTAGKDYDKITLIGYVLDALNNQVETSSATVTLVVPEDPVASTTTLLQSYEETSNAMDSTEKLNYLSQMANQLSSQVSEDQTASGQSLVSDLKAKINAECSSDQLTDALIDQCASAYESTLSAASSLTSTGSTTPTEDSSTILTTLNNLLSQVSTLSDTFLINYQESTTKANSYGNVSERAKARGTQDTLTVDSMLTSMCSKVSDSLLIEGMSKEVSSTSMKTICSEYEKADLTQGLLQNLLITQSGTSYSVGIMANADTISSSDSTVTVSTSSTFTTFSELSEDITQISNSFIYSISGLTDSESCDTISVTLALLSSLLPESYEEASIKCYSIINGILQEVTVESIDIENSEIVCSSCESGSYLAAYVVSREVPIDDDGEDDEEINIDRDHDWEVWSNMNPSYIVVLLLAGLVVSGVVGFILDKYSPEKEAKPNTHIGIHPTFQACPGDQKVAPEEKVSHPHSPARFNSSQSQAWMQNESPEKTPNNIENSECNENYLDTTTIHQEEKPGCCEYMFREHIIISFFVNTKPCYSRTARAKVFFSVLFMQLAIIGALLEYSDIDEFVYASIIVAGITLFAGPVFSLLYIVPSKLVGIKRVVKIVIAWLSLFILLVVTIIPIIIKTEDDIDNDDNRFWLKAFAVSVSFEIFISEPIRTAIKFGIQKHLRNELVQAF